MRKNQRQSHGELVAKLERELMLHESYSAIGTYLAYYSPNGRALGEIDVYGINFKEGRLDIYEVKCTHSHTERARDQLQRARRFFSPHFDFVGIYSYLDGELKREG